MPGRGQTGAWNFRDKLDDFESHPEDWQEVSTHVEKSTRKGARRQGVSTQRIYKHKASGDTIVRHTVTNDSGRVVDDHYRPDYQPREGDLDESIHGS